jgi:integrase
MEADMAHTTRRVLKDGTARWYARYLGADGKYHEQGGFTNDRAAERAAHRLESDAARGDWASPTKAKMTFAAYVEAYYWPTTAHLELSTRTAYRYNLDKHFITRFGAMPMRRITASHIQSWVNDAAASRLSARSVVKYHALLHKIFGRAVIDQVVPFNPCRHSELPKTVAKAKRIITPAEFDAIWEAVPERFQLMVLVAIETGLRWGELIALRPADLNIAARAINVRRTIVEVSRRHSPTGERTVIKEYPKSDKPRIVQIEPATCRKLRAHIDMNTIGNDALLFTSTAGTALSRNTFRTKYWTPAVEAAGIVGTVTFHNLRAAHASWLLAGGADLQTVKERLGHAQISTTEQYLGTLPDAGDRALAAFRRTRDGA